MKVLILILMPLYIVSCVWCLIIYCLVYGKLTFHVLPNLIQGNLILNIELIAQFQEALAHPRVSFSVLLIVLSFACSKSQIRLSSFQLVSSLLDSLYLILLQFTSLLIPGVRQVQYHRIITTQFGRALYIKLIYI